MDGSQRRASAASDLRENKRVRLAYSECRVFSVSDSRELIMAIKRAQENDEIRLANDIHLTSSVEFDHSLVLNLCGHTLFAGYNGSSVCIGKKVYAGREKEKSWVEGYSKNLSKTMWDGDVGWKQVWVPGHYEYDYRDVYYYDKTVDVMFKNGMVLQAAKGRDGKDGTEDVFVGCDGESGTTPPAPVYLISGILRLKSCKVKGGDGGNGGNGRYQSLWHIPLGTGRGGDGGDGGYGGLAVVYTAHGKFSLEDANSALIKGKPGIGGRGSAPNPNFWLYSGRSGCDGRDGA